MMMIEVIWLVLLELTDYNHGRFKKNPRILF
jgi:hypothetical protein